MERETIINILWECNEVHNFLQSIKILIEALMLPFSFNKDSFVFGLLNLSGLSNRIDNEVILIIKQFIYRSRCRHKSLSINAFIHTVKDYYTVQKCIAIGKGVKLLRNISKKLEKVIELIDP